MTRCANQLCRRECWLGVNATYLNPAKMDDYRVLCDECAGNVRDGRGMIYSREVSDEGTESKLGQTAQGGGVPPLLR
jgi:hypothetical protein